MEAKVAQAQHFFQPCVSHTNTYCCGACRHADNVKAEQERLSAEAMVAIAAAGDKEKVVEAILREYNEAAREVEEKEKELLQAKEAAKTKAKQLDIARCGICLAISLSLNPNRWQLSVMHPLSLYSSVSYLTQHTVCPIFTSTAHYLQIAV